jgi:pimeloyl-ACP methyl ester carboxylesterase
MDVVEEEGVLRTPDGHRIGWMRRGVRGGTPVGFLHGQPGSRHDLRVLPDATLARHEVELFAIDRAGYGDTPAVGLDRRDVARDLLTLADHLGVQRFPLMAVSMGGVYALTVAALAPERVTRVVLLAGHVLPYDDPAIVGLLSAEEQADVAQLRGGRTPELEATYAEAAAAMATAPGEVLAGLAVHWSPAERALATTPFAAAVAASMAFGLAHGHDGLLEDGLRTVQPLEFGLADVRCPVRAVHGTIDDLEPYANVERLMGLLPDGALVALPGRGHLGPWLWPDLGFALLTGT